MTTEQKADWSEAGWRQFPVRVVPVASIRSQQDRVDNKWIDKLVKTGCRILSPWNKEWAIKLVTRGGAYYIWDGHHRFNCMKRIGKAGIKARVRPDVRR